MYGFILYTIAFVAIVSSFCSFTIARAQACSGAADRGASCSVQETEGAGDGGVQAAAESRGGQEGHHRAGETQAAAGTCHQTAGLPAQGLSDVIVLYIPILTLNNSTFLERTLSVQSFVICMYTNCPSQVEVWTC